MVTQIVSITLDVIAFVLVLVLCYRYVSLRKEKDSVYYTDYVHKEHILRVYKSEFEYEAVGKVPREKILDQGVLSQFYLWTLIEK